MNLFDTWLHNPILVTVSLILLILINLRLLITGSKLRLEGFVHHFNQPLFHANPDINAWFDNRGKIPTRIVASWGIQILFVFVSSLMVYIIYEPEIINYIGKWAEWIKKAVWFIHVSEFIIGFILGRYIQSILNIRGINQYFRFMRNNPSSLTGSLTFSSNLLYFQIRQDLIFTAVVWSLIFLLTFRVFFLGGIGTLIWMFLRTYTWEKQVARSGS
jgi:hypothetical protein